MIGAARMSLEAAAEMARSVEIEAIYAENQRTRKIARLNGCEIHPGRAVRVVAVNGTQQALYAPS
jgi:hypothetical protein